MLSKHTIRDKSARLFPVIPPCEECGSTRMVQRHHPNYETHEMVQFLCIDCHAKADQRDGFRKVKKAKICPICGTEFRHYTHSRNKTCSRECLSELGRRNARKRWHPEAA